MTFPTIAAEASSNTATALAEHIISMPAGVSVGEVLLTGFVTDQSVTTNMAGWTSLGYADRVGVVSISIYYRQSDGTEGADEILSTSPSRPSLHHVWRLEGAEAVATQAPEISVGTSATDASPDTAIVTPTGGSKDYLFFSLVGLDALTTADTFPASYTNTGFVGLSAVCGLAYASRPLAAMSEDPGAFNLTASDQWAGFTVVIHPAPAVGGGGTLAARIGVGQALGPSYLR